MMPNTRHWQRHETLTGEVLRYPPPAAEVDAYLERVRRAADDREVGEDAMIDLVYARDNPLLESTVFADRGAVTREVFANPLYQVMTDLLDRKRAQLGLLDPLAASARYTMTVEEAAAALDVRPGVVLHAIRLRQLGVCKKDGVRLLDPDSLPTFRRFVLEGSRSPQSPALRVRVGNRPGISFQVRAADTEVVATHRLGDGGKVLEVGVPPFERVAVRFRVGRRRRFLVLEPSELESELHVDEFGVAGRFIVVEEISDPGEAARRWALFRPV